LVRFADDAGRRRVHGHRIVNNLNISVSRHAACDPRAIGQQRPIPGQETPLRNALVPLAPIGRDGGPPRANIRAHADFIAHLIATAAQAPQTRARRRAEPQQATAAYRALGQWPTASGRSVCRSL
jgi:hypothetical protein